MNGSPLTHQPDLLRIVQADTRVTDHGKERHGPCPLCGGTDRFWVRPEDGRWFCRQCTPKGGDAISYVMQRDRVGFRQAVATLEGAPLPAPLPQQSTSDRPTTAWLAVAERVIAACAAALWEPDGARARSWLAARGLAEATLRHAQIGFNNQDCWVTIPSADGKARPASLCYGITIPVWGVDGALYGLRIRRPVARDSRGRQKYLSLAGSRNALYGTLAGRDTLLITEGYFDCLLAAQYAGDALDVATLNLCRPAGRWLRHLLGYRRILVCLDGDDAGQKAWAQWSWMGSARQVHLPAGKDITQAVVDHGLDLRAWLAEQLAPTRPVVAMVPEVHEPAPEICPPEERWTVADDPWMAGSEEGF